MIKIIKCSNLSTFVWSSEAVHLSMMTLYKMLMIACACKYKEILIVISCVLLQVFFYIIFMFQLIFVMFYEKKCRHDNLLFNEGSSGSAACQWQPWWGNQLTILIKFWIDDYLIVVCCIYIVSNDNNVFLMRWTLKS